MKRFLPILSLFVEFAIPQLGRETSCTPTWMMPCGNAICCLAASGVSRKTTLTITVSTAATSTRISKQQVIPHKNTSEPKRIIRRDRHIGTNREQDRVHVSPLSLAGSLFFFLWTSHDFVERLDWSVRCGAVLPHLRHPSSFLHGRQFAPNHTEATRAMPTDETPSRKRRRQTIRLRRTPFCPRFWCQQRSAG